MKEKLGKSSETHYFSSQNRSFMKELEARKTSIIRKILELDEDRIDILEEVIHKMDNPMPCVFTKEEQLAQIEQGIMDQAAGLGQSHEEIAKKYQIHNI